MGYVFDVYKSVQSLAYIIKRLGTNQINILKALKLLYLVDRAALADSLTLVTGDSPVAMNKGPVLSKTYDLMKTGKDWPAKSEEEIYWTKFFERSGNELLMIDNPGEESLSKFDRRILDLVVENFGHKNNFELVDYTHTFPEWIKNQRGNSSAPIPFEDILTALEKTEFIEDFLNELNSEIQIDNLLKSGI